jgi:hypothetical protein
MMRVADGYWSRPGTNPRGEMMELLLAILHGMSAPMSAERERRAALLAMEPHLLSSHLDASQATQWRRVSDTALLRASHIKPWAKCETDAERMDVHNGLLLSALRDAAFDKGLATFDDDGTPYFSPKLSAEARAALSWKAAIPLTELHRKHLGWHRAHEFAENSREYLK